MPIKNPIGPKVPLGNGFAYQRISLTRGNGYIKVWYKGQVIDRAITVPKAREMAKRYAERELLL